MDTRVVKRNAILVITLWMKQQPSNLLLLEEYLKSEESSLQAENVIYIGYCLNRQKQSVDSAVCWKPCLRNYNSHIKNNVKSWKIVRYFTQEREGVSNLCFIIIYELNNVGHFSLDEIYDLLLQKEQFWIGALFTQHKRLNGTHDWRRTKRFKRIRQYFP